MIKINVAASRAYDVLIERGLLSRAPELICGVAGNASVALVCDDTVDALYGAALERQLIAAGVKTVKFVFAAGEDSKNAGTVLSLLSLLAREGFSRGDVIAALGGGVTGDMAGLAAALYMRGIRYIQLPTTLLAMTDSSVGGKTAVDLPEGKNLCGAFWQPSLVICDPDTLSTLPRETYADGMAEVVKYGVIRDGALLSALAGGTADEVKTIARCVEIKRDIVVEDEREGGVRALLNFGHTPAHAIEKLSGWKIAHGSAVAAGMLIMTHAARKMSLCDRECEKYVAAAIEAQCTPRGMDFLAAELAREALGDKKRRGEYITLVMPRRIGYAEAIKYPTAELEAIFARGLES